MNSRPSRILALALVLLALGSGCARSRANDAPSSPPAPAAASDVHAALPAADRALAVTLDVGLSVSNVDDATNRVREATGRAGGFVADQSRSGEGDDRRARLTLRVPADRLLETKEALFDLGDVTSEVEKVEDVTEQRADVGARLSNARVQEKRILELVSQRTSSIAEVVEAEKELARVRENVERLEAQQRTLEGRIAMATVDVTLTTRTTPAWQTPGKSLARSSEKGVRGAAALAVYGAMAVVTVAPTALPLAAIVVAALLAARRRRRAHGAPVDEAA